MPPKAKRDRDQSPVAQKLNYAITIQCTEQDFRDVNEYIAKYLSVPRSRSYVALTALRQFIAASKEGDFLLKAGRPRKK